jgi:hypothetical protein
MRTIRNSFGSLVIIGGLIRSLNFVHAQTATVGSFNGDIMQVQSAQSDSIVSVVAEAQGLQLVSPDQVPAYGTFWTVLPGPGGGVIPPFPCPPLDPGLHIYTIADGQFLVDGTANIGGASAAVLEAQADAVVNLIDRIQATEANRQMQVMAGNMMAMDVPTPGDGGDGGTNGSFTSNYTPPDYGTNLWLEITNIADGAVDLLLHNSQPGVPYELLSKQTLLDAQWISEGMVTGVDNDIVTPATVSIGERTDSLFIRALSWVDSDADGIPDWWMLKYFGHPTGEATDHSLAGDDYDSNGVDNLAEYLAGTDPNKIRFALQFTNNYVNNGIAYGTITVLGGVPSSMALLINSTNFAGATWQPYGANVVASLNSGDGNYDIWVGLRGLPVDAQQTWQWAGLVLDTIPPAITVTNPTTSVVSKPTIQVQGYAGEPLGNLTFDVSNAAGIITNQPGFLAGQFYDTNLLSFTTNWFQCYDVGLVNGLNTITLHATDLAGNTTTASFGVTLDYSGDTTPPALTVVWPQEGMSVGGDTFTLRGIVDDETAHVAVSGLTANPIDGLVQRDGQFWIANLPLTNGDNTLTVTATDAAGNSMTNNITVFKSDVTLIINPVSANDLRQPTVTVYGTISDTSYTVWVNGVEATVNEDGTWEADNVPVNGRGIATFDAVAYPPGAAPAARMLFAVRSMDAGGGSSVDQSLVEVMPSLVRVTSYQDNDQLAEEVNGNVGGYPITSLETRIVDWVLGVGGYSSNHTSGSEYWYDGGAPCDSYVEWPTNWPDGETLNGESCAGDYSESPNPAWQHCSVNQSSSYITSGEYGPITISHQRHRTAQTKIELVVGGQVQTNAQQIILLTASAVEYSRLAVDMAEPFPAYAPFYPFDGAGDVPLPASAIRILGQTPMPTATNDNVGDLILTLPAGTVRDITPTILYPLNQNYYSFDVQVTDVNLQLAVDANRDGNITFDAADQTTAAKPYRFWVNNDQDTDAGDVIPVTSPDYGNDQIKCIRDLEDFVRMNIFVQGITNEIAQGTFKIGLKWKNTTGFPAIKLWKNKSPDGGIQHLTDTNIAQQFLTLRNPGEVAWTETYFIPTNFWQDMIINTTNSTGYLFFEGCSVGKGQLVLTINKPDGTEIAEVGGVWLDLEDISTMYEQAIVTEDTTGAISNWTSTVTVQNPLPASPGEAQDIIVFVHGINVSLLDWYVESDTVFKRLFWAGYQGKFATVKWPCESLGLWTVLNTDTSVFNRSEVTAYKAGSAMKTYIDQLHARFPGYRLHLLVHSQGNAVVSEAIRQGATFDTYILTQGALPASAYDVYAPVETSLIAAEMLHSTPEWQPMGYHGIYTNFPGQIVNFYNTNDPVLACWVLDQAAAKPDGLLKHLAELATPPYIPISPYYSYSGTNGWHYSFPLSSYLVTDPQESRAYVSRSLTLPIGQSGPESQHGVIKSGVDLNARYKFNDAFPDDHSAQWTWPIQTSLPYYDQVLVQIKPLQ